MPGEEAAASAGRFLASRRLPERKPERSRLYTTRLRHPRVMVARRWIGFRTVNSCIHFGMPSIGFNDPDNENRSGFTKNPSSIDCFADLLKDAIVVPTPMPHKRQSAVPQVNSAKLP